MSALTDGADWKEIYQRYVQLERNLSVRDAPESIARKLFRRIVCGHKIEREILREFRSFRLEPPGPDVLREAFLLQRALYPCDYQRPSGRYPGKRYVVGLLTCYAFSQFLNSRA
jgi:hypothetical protein